jgi:hypothetical protein
MAIDDLLVTPRADELEQESERSETGTFANEGRCCRATFGTEPAAKQGGLRDAPPHKARVARSRGWQPSVRQERVVARKARRNPRNALPRAALSEGEIVELMHGR